jgi:hypothetical protein
MEVGIHMTRMGKWRIGLTGGRRGQLGAGRLWSGEHLINLLRNACNCFFHLNIP